MGKRKTILPETPSEDQVALASFLLEGDAQLWYQVPTPKAENGRRHIGKDLQYVP